jgi:hypothetical protein
MLDSMFLRNLPIAFSTYFISIIKFTKTLRRDFSRGAGVDFREPRDMFAGYTSG